jgi:hypothetical protein
VNDISPNTDSAHFMSNPESQGSWTRRQSESPLGSGNFSRRSLIALCAIVSLSGCAEDEASKIARDPYLPTMMKDPLYTWRPAGDLSRTEALLPRSTDNFASGTAVSSILITFTFRTVGNAAALLQEAQSVSASAGYENDTRVLLPGVNVMCTIITPKDENGLLIVLVAPE